MRKNIVVLLLLSGMMANAQVWNGHLSLRSQQEIDDISNFGYTTVTGQLSINDGVDGEYDIRNLAGLASISSVGGNLSISNCTLLPNLAFLNVTSVGGISIVNNDAL